MGYGAVLDDPLTRSQVPPQVGVQRGLCGDGEKRDKQDRCEQTARRQRPRARGEPGWHGKHAGIVWGLPALGKGNGVMAAVSPSG